jgi:hypothetical protein
MPNHQARIPGHGGQNQKDVCVESTQNWVDGKVTINVSFPGDIEISLIRNKSGTVEITGTLGGAHQIGGKITPPPSVY